MSVKPPPPDLPPAPVSHLLPYISVSFLPPYHPYPTFSRLPPSPVSDVLPSPSPPEPNLARLSAPSSVDTLPSNTYLHMSEPSPPHDLTTTSRTWKNTTWPPRISCSLSPVSRHLPSLTISCLPSSTFSHFPPPPVPYRQDGRSNEESGSGADGDSVEDGGSSDRANMEVRSCHGAPPVCMDRAYPFARADELLNSLRTCAPCSLRARTSHPAGLPMHLR
jgi:hypothetical protein